MITTLVLPVVLALVASGLLALAAPRLGRWLPPAVATRLLPASAVLLAAATGLTLSVTSCLLVAGVPRIGRVGRLAVPGAAGLGEWTDRVGSWSGVVLPWRGWLPSGAGYVVAALVAVLLVAACRRCVQLVRALRSAHAALEALGGGGRDLVIDDPVPQAVAVAGRPGRVVVSTGLLRALSPVERVAVIAHERSHLANRHHLWVFLARLAAAADPLLTPVVAATVQAAERSADEDAAAAVRDRRAVACALARVALAHARSVRAGADRSVGRGGPTLGTGPFGSATAGPSRIGGAVAFHAGGDVVRRAEALLAPVPPRRPASVAVLALLVALTAGVSVALAATSEGILDRSDHPTAAVAPLVRH